MGDILVRPIHDHLPLWLLLLPALSAVGLGVSRLVGREVAVPALRVNWCLSLALVVWLIIAYDPLKPAESREQAAMSGPIQRFQFRDSLAWVGEDRTALVERTRRNGDRQVIEVPIRWGPDIRFELGVDGLSVWFVALSVLLVAVGAEDATANSKNARPLAWLWLQVSLVGTFLALDVVLFSVGWMSTLLALAWMLGCDGDSQRHTATPRFVTAVCLGGWLVTLGLCGLVLAFAWLRPSVNRPETPLSFAIPELLTGIGQLTAAGDNAYLWASINTWLFWLLVVGFTWPLWLVPWHHGFLEAFVAAPRGIAIVLSAVFVKVGIYGWLRFVLPLFPELIQRHSAGFTMLVGLSSLLAASLAFGATDWRERIALATCGSLGLSLIGLLTQTLEGLAGGVLRTFSHGLAAALLLWCLPDRGLGSRLANNERSQTVLDSNASSTGGCAGAAVIMDESVTESGGRRHAWLLRLAVLAWIGMPGFSGFVAEFLTPFGLFQHSFEAAAFSLATSGLIAWMWVRAERESLDWSGADRSGRRMWIAGGLVALNLGLGLAPQFLLDRLQPGLVALVPWNDDVSAVVPHTSAVVEVR